MSSASLVCIVGFIFASLAWTGGYKYVECEKGKLCTSSFTYTVTNSLIWPFFNHSIAMKLKEGKPVIYYMAKAVETDPSQFESYDVRYYQHYGYLVEGVNGLVANWKDNHTYWEFWNATTALSQGVSEYIPSPGDMVLLNFTVDSRLPKRPRYTNARL